MGKGSKLFGIVLLLAGVACIGMYFVMGDKYSNFKVIFDSNGGSAVVEQIVKPGEKAIKPADPTKENNEFIEWQLNGIAYNFDNVVSKNLTLQASWREIIMYNVKVTLDGQDYVADVVAGSPVTLELLNIPAKEGYNVKFYKENNEEYDINLPLNENVVLTAQYVEIKTYTVKFDSNGGSKVEDVKVVENSVVPEPTSTREGYILDGWYIGEEKFNFGTSISKDITLKARWNDGPKINVIFMVDGTAYKTISVKENTKVSKPSNPTKKGYKFVEWQLNGAAFDFNTPITSEITLTAVFEESKSVTVTYDSAGGSNVASQEVETGGKATAPTNPTKEGYKFVEWQLNGKKYDFNTAVNENIKLTAVWVKTYTVKFVADGKEISNQVVVEGEKVTKPADPTKEGYKFAEWLSESHTTYDFNTAVNANMTITARFEKINDTTMHSEQTGDQTPIPNTGDEQVSDEDK